MPTNKCRADRHKYHYLAAFIEVADSGKSHQYDKAAGGDLMRNRLLA